MDESSPGIFTKIFFIGSRPMGGSALNASTSVVHPSLFYCVNIWSCVCTIACDPDGRGPNATCLATCSNARLPSNPPVLCGDGASSAPPCAAFVAAALTAAGFPAAPFASPLFALHPVKVKSPAHKKSATCALNFHAAHACISKSHLTPLAFEPT